MSGLLWASISYSQHVVKGTVQNEQGEPIEGVNILVVENSSGTISDDKGLFELRLNTSGKYSLQFSHLQYHTQIINLNTDALPESISIILETKEEILEGLEVIAKEPNVIAVNRVRLSTENLNLAPVPFQEITSIIATLPSVTSNNELSSAYSVRGGNYDENLVLVNGIPVYRPFLVRSGQEEGLSFINTDLISSVDFSAGGWSVEYDDKMSSVLSATYKSPKQFGGSAMISLLGTKAHLEGKIGDNTEYLIGARHKRAGYLLNTLNVKGNYDPKFTDIQTFWKFRLSDKTSIDLLGAYANNNYQLVPEMSSVSFGTFNKELRLNVAFDGQQQLKYHTMQGAVKLNHRVSPNIYWSTILSVSNYNEQESIDLEAGYRLCDVDKNVGSATFDECISLRGIGTIYNYSRNQLSAVLIDAESALSYQINESQALNLGVAYSRQLFDDYINEFELIDSAGYVNVEDQMLGEHDTRAHIIKGYVQHSIDHDQWSWVYGVRINHNTINRHTLVSPRVLVNYVPEGRGNIDFSMGIGVYQQQPFYKEYRNTDGSLITDIKGQSSAHINLGVNYRMTWWGRQFKLSTEAYYKYLWNQIPYIIENVRLQYYPEYKAHAYAVGFETRLGGEFIPGTESWFSLGILSTEERIDELDEDYVRRPTDQRFKIGFVFEDHIPGDPSLRVNLNFQYGSGLPVGPPNTLIGRNSFGGGDYTRLDIGFSKIIKFDDKMLDFVRLGVEINNLIGSRNAVSYTWIKDVYNQQFAVPNYLTGRLFNVVLTTQF